MVYTILGLAVLVISIMAILEIIKSSRETVHKALWIAAIVVFPLIGLIAYYVIGRKVATA